MKRSIAAAAACTGLLVGPLATATAVPEPPKSKLNVTNVTAKCATKPNGNKRITGNADIWWGKAPKKKGPTTIGHYLRVKAQIMAPAGVNGTLWKSLEKKRYKTDTFYLPAKGLPRSYGAPVSYTAREGQLKYRTKITVRVIRDVRLAVDTTAWKGVYWSPPTTCSFDGQHGT